MKQTTENPTRPQTASSSSEGSSLETAKVRDLETRDLVDHENQLKAELDLIGKISMRCAHLPESEFIERLTEAAKNGQFKGNPTKAGYFARIREIEAELDAGHDPDGSLPPCPFCRCGENLETTRMTDTRPDGREYDILAVKCQACQAIAPKDLWENLDQES